MHKQLLTSADAVQAKCQHKTPCSDCPWSRKALPGWLGPYTSDEWIHLAHSDVVIDCHTLNGAQCAGNAIYRRNVVKFAGQPLLRLEADHKKVFSTPQEFKDYHNLKNLRKK